MHISNRKRGEINNMCEYCREGNGVGKSILHDNDFEFLNIFIMNGMIWEKSMDMGTEINYCPMCRKKVR